MILSTTPETLIPSQSFVKRNGIGSSSCQVASRLKSLSHSFNVPGGLFNSAIPLPIPFELLSQIVVLDLRKGQLPDDAVLLDVEAFSFIYRLVKPTG